MEVRIIGIKKAGGDHYDPHEAVSYYQWLNEQSSESNLASRVDMVSWVEQGNRAYVRDNRGIVDCRVRTSQNGTKFLQTYADGRWTDNLLNLPEA